MTKYLLNSAVITTPGVYEYHVSYPSAEASGLPASSTRLDPHYRVTVAPVSTGVNSPRTAGTQKNFSQLHLKLSPQLNPQKRQALIVVVTS